MQRFSIFGTPGCLHPAANDACASNGLPSCLQCKILQGINMTCRNLKMCACAGVPAGGCAAGGAGGDGLHLGRQPEVPAAGACICLLAPSHEPFRSSHAPYGVQSDTCLLEGRVHYWHKHCLHINNCQSVCLTASLLGMQASCSIKGQRASTLLVEAIHCSCHAMPPGVEW